MSHWWQDFHFLRPAWLLLLPALWLLLYSQRQHFGRRNPWLSVIEPALLAHLLPPGAQRSRRGLLLLAATGSGLLVLALAGPAWRQLPQPVYKAPVHRVLVMDLSSPMNAADIKPNRLQRSKLVAHQLLNAQQEGDTGLVAFAAQAFPVVPLTTDKATVGHLLDSLNSTLMPEQGQNIAAGIEAAVSLLQRAEAHRAQILLFTNATANASAQVAASQAASLGFRLQVFAAGTASGAPVPNGQGGWHKDAQGGIRLARLDEASLRELAKQGGGSYVRVEQVTADWALPDSATWNREGRQPDDDFRADIWADEGHWLLLPLLLLSAVAFRRGWLMLLILGSPGLLLAPPAEAGWWRNADQQAHAQLEAGDAETAAENFRSPAWRASALYRAGRYAEAAELWRQSETAQAAYNEGNALARQGDLQGALSAYDRALQRNPKLQDAKDNRALVERLLQQQPPQDQQQDGEPSSKGPPDQQDQADQQTQDDRPQGDPSSADQTPGEQASQEQSSEQQGQNPAQDDQTGSAQSAAGDQPPEPEEHATDSSGTSADPTQADDAATQQGLGTHPEPDDEQAQAVQQWLNRIPDDPGRLLREKFRRMQQRRQGAAQEDASW